MKKFKFQLSAFDIGMLIAFAVIGLLGGGAWFYLSGQLQAAQDKDKSVSTAYNGVAAANGIIVNQVNTKTLQANADQIETQLDPIFGQYLLTKDNDLSNAKVEDPTAWKHELDDDVKTLTTDAKGITLKKGFYFGFSRYVTETPNDAGTAVLTKQRAAIKAISEILINAPVKAINGVRRTYEEDPHKPTDVVPSGERAGGEGDQLAGYAVALPDTYTAYPFEFDFDAAPEAIRPIIDQLLKSPYLFVLRRIEVHSDQLTSPAIADLPKMAGGTPGALPPPPMTDSSPGQVAQAAPTAGPQYLFGHAVLHVKIRVDMIEWNPLFKSVDDLGKKVKQP